MTHNDPRHGRNSGYAAGCRDECCQRAHARQMNLWRMGRTSRLVPAIGTHRRVQALMALGWSRVEMSHMLGHQRDYLTKVARQKAVRAGTARSISTLYERLSMKLPPDTPASRRTRAMACRRGYLPPLAWDDEDLDNPMKTPLRRRTIVPKDVDQAVIERVLSGERLPATVAEKREIMRRWLASGRSERQLCQRMGWKEGRYTGRPVGTEAQPETPEQEAS